MADIKSIYKLVFTAAIFLLSLPLSAQNLQHKNDSLIVLIGGYLNTKNTDALYNLTNKELRYYITKKNFSRYLKEKIFPSGQIKDFIPISNKTVNSSYKLKTNRDTLLLTLNLDSIFKIRVFIVEKYHPKPVNKPNLVATSNPLNTDLEKKIDAVVRTYIQKPYTVGLSVGVFYGGKNSIYNYGETVKGSGKLPDENTIFEIGTISQTFTATLLAYFVNQGKIKLTDPITKYLPDSVSENIWLKTVSILSLSNYTSGLVYFPYYPDLEKRSSSTTNRNFTNDQFFLYLKRAIPRSKPGEVYAYSDIPYNLLALILERATHRSYDELVKTIICGPLGLNSTVQLLPQKALKNQSKFYNARGVETVVDSYGSLKKTGSLKATVSDLLKYAAANMDEQKNDELFKALQLTHEITFSSKTNKLGLGWHVIKLANREYYCSIGSSSFLAFNKEKNIAVVILSNSAEPTDSIGRSVIKLLQ